MAPANGKVNTKWFRDRITDRGLSARRIAFTMGLDPASMSLMIRGMRGMSPQEAADLATILEVPYADVLKHAGIQLPSETESGVLLSGTVTVDGSVSPDVAAPKRVARPLAGHAGMTAVRVTAPGQFSDGWVAYFTPGKRLDPEAVGKLAVVQLAGKAADRLFGVLVRGHDRGRWTVRNVGGSALRENVLVEWAVPVEWVKT